MAEDGSDEPYDWAEGMPELAEVGPCDQVGPRIVGPNGRTLRRVACNRTTGHDGPHRHYDLRSFAILAEWNGSASP